MLTERDSIDKSYVWGYLSKYPVAEIAGKGYEDPASLLNSSIINNPATETIMNIELKKLYTLTGSTLVNTYTHKSFAGISIHSTPQQTELRYEYDSFNRLNTIKDPNNQVVKQFNYHYQPSEYANHPYFSTNVPRMESFFPLSGNGYARLNIFRPGGIDRVYTTPLPSEPPILNEPNTTFISLGSEPLSSLSIIETVNSLFSIEKEFIFDFVQDGSVVATRTIYLNKTNPYHIYLLPGKYTVVIRTKPEAYDEYRFTQWYFANSYEELKTGDEIQVMAGNTYRLIASQSFFQ
jgi:YD repeat-containing protein